MTSLLNDIKYAFRQLVKSPGFTAVAVISLALGIGANTAIFSLVNAILLRSLPVPNPHELRVINWIGYKISISNFSGRSKKISGGARAFGSFPYPAYCDFRDRAAGFSDVFAFAALPDCTMVTNRGSATLEGLMVSGNFFRGYGTPPFLGRTILPEHDQPGAPPVAVITYRVWERYFGLDPQVVGQSLTLNNSAFTIIGVLPRGYIGPLTGDKAGFYVPMSAQPQLLPYYPLGSPKHWWVQIMGRLTPDAMEVQIQTSLEVLFHRTLDATDASIENPGILLEDGRCGPVIERLFVPALALQGVVILVLLIACVNLASLLLARGAVRRREMAVRAAVGAGRGRLIRQSLTESLVLASLGAGAGLLFAAWVKAGLLRFLTHFDANFHIDAQTDLNVLLFTFVATVITALLCGLLPAVHASRVDPARALQGDRASLTPRLRLSRALLIGQVALSLLLVMGAGLLVRTLINLRQVNPGFDTENLLLFRLDAGQAGYRGQKLLNFYEDLRQSVAAIPGVRSVAMSNLTLLGQSSRQSTFSISEQAGDEKNDLQAHELVISDGYFATMGISLLHGRDFSEGDVKENRPVVIINETFARLLLPGKEAIGRSIRCGMVDYEIVGVCRDAKYDSLRKEIPPTVYYSYRQSLPGSLYFAARSILPPQSLAPAVRKVVGAINSTIPLAEITTQTELLEKSIMAERLFTRLCGSLAVLALVLCWIGLYGLMAYNVAHRTNEFGIRMALGATSEQVFRPVLREALVAAGSGIAVGLPVAIALFAALRGFLYGIPSFDPVAMIGSVMVLLVVAILAAWIPARRAAKVDPMVALRCE